MRVSLFTSAMRRAPGNLVQGSYRVVVIARLIHGARLLSVVAICWLSAGCATLINLAINPQGVANQAANDLVSSITDVNVQDLSNASSGDIDRILREHPDAVNKAQLTDLKGNLQSANLLQNRVPPENLQNEYAAQHDRRIATTWRKRTDNVVLAPLTQYYAVPYGIRSTSRSHYPNDGLSLPEQSSATIDLQPVRFKNR